MSVARRLAVAFAVVGLGVLAYAVPASATESGAADTAAATTTDTSALPCVDGTVLSNLEVVVADGAKFDPTDGVAVVRGKGGAPICAGTDARLTLSLYHVPDTWDGTPFPGGQKTGDAGLAWPQTELAHQTAVLKGDKPVTLTVAVPDCGNVQIDLYTGFPIKKVNAGGHPKSKLIFAALWSIGGPNGHPAVCAPETTPPSTTSPAPTTTAPSSPAPPTTSPAAPTTSAASVPPVATSPGPPPPAQPIVEATPPSVATTPPPVLASTGSSTTIPLLGLGVALLGAGIGLSLLGRRRKTV
jgi:LPXTG-motif cell wall-anchored protein